MSAANNVLRWTTLSRNLLRSSRRGRQTIKRRGKGVEVTSDAIDDNAPGNLTAMPVPALFKVKDHCDAARGSSVVTTSAISRRAHMVSNVSGRSAKFIDRYSLRSVALVAAHGGRGEWWDNARGYPKL